MKRAIFAVAAVAAFFAAAFAADLSTVVSGPPQTTDTPARLQERIAVQTSRASTIATGQVALSTSATLVLAANAARRSVALINNDASITMYVGASGVTSATGAIIKPGQSPSIDSTAAIYAVAASGTPTISYIAEND